jgi:hypothetical protein
MVDKKSKTPLAVENNVLIRTVTHYFTGKISEINPSHLVLENAAWIADTGRFSDALTSGMLKEVEPFKDPVAIMIGGIIDATTWSHDLPNKQK